MKQLPPPHFGSHGWVFTDEDRERIKDALAVILPATGKIKYIAADENIEQFINQIEPICSAREYWFMGKPKQKEIRKNREDILTNCKAALGYLRRVHGCTLETSHYENLDPFMTEGEDPVSQFRLEAWEACESAMMYLDKFIRILEEYHLKEQKKRGRKTADNDHFIRKIMESYIQCIGKPTDYSDGPFYNLVRVFLGIKYPEKGIREALKK